jgi:HEAT repeat protein
MSRPAQPKRGLTGLEDAKRRGDIDYIVEALTNPDRKVRLVAAYNLGELRARAGVPALVRIALHAADEALRIVALKALASIGAPEVAPDLRVLAHSETSLPVRTTAISALVTMHDADVIAPLISLITSDLSREGNLPRRDARAARKWAATQLVELGATQALPALERMLNEARLSERRNLSAAIRALRARTDASPL